MLPLKPQPLVSGSKDSSVESLGELNDCMVEEPACKGQVFNNCLGMGRPGIKVIRTDKLSQLRPLEVCCTVGEENGGQYQWSTIDSR